MIKTGATDFKRGRKSTRSGKPKIVTTTEIVAKVHKNVLNERWLKSIEIADAMDISTERSYLLYPNQSFVKESVTRAMVTETVHTTAKTDTSVKIVWMRNCTVTICDYLLQRMRRIFTTTHQKRRSNRSKWLLRKSNFSFFQMSNAPS